MIAPDIILLTPTGFIKAADLVPEDHLISPYGTSTKVIATKEERRLGVKAVLEDNSTIVCCSTQIWQTTKTFRFAYELQPDEEFFCSPLRITNNRKLRVDPYLMGVYLGDGSGCRKITTGDEEMPGIIRDILRKTGGTIEHQSKYDWTVKDPTFTNGLRAYDLEGKRSWEKYVPKDYLFASDTARLQVLQGLLDTDGYNRKNTSMVVYTTTSPWLRDNALHLVRSLGGKANWRSREPVKDKAKGTTHRTAYIIHIWLPPHLSPFRLSRRTVQYKTPNKDLITRKIAEVWALGEVPQIHLTTNGDFMTADFITIKGGTNK